MKVVQILHFACLTAVWFRMTNRVCVFENRLMFPKCWTSYLTFRKLPIFGKFSACWEYEPENQMKRGKRWHLIGEASQTGGKKSPIFCQNARAGCLASPIFCESGQNFCDVRQKVCDALPMDLWTLTNGRSHLIKQVWCFAGRRAFYETFGSNLLKSNLEPHIGQKSVWVNRFFGNLIGNCTGSNTS